MARYPEHFIQQVLQATDIVDLVGQYVALKQKGREFVGLCPFHDDRNPSMFVSPAKQIYKCFACGAGGNSLQFLMNYDRQSFPEAVRSLAERANIPLPKEVQQPTTGSEGLSKHDLLEATEFAAGFFREALASPAGRAALDYARRRELSEASIERFGIGYAPDSWDALLNAARQKGIGEGRLLAAGLVRRRESGGCYDYFRNRLMFPIHDLSGRVVAFGGRAMDPEERAKYLNSPESALYEKSSLLFALPFAREAIVRSGTAVVTEGYFDALMPVQAGVENVVATLGTALTERHVRLLSRYAKEAVLVFDADEAGTAAAERALQLFLSQQLHVRVATISAGKDPCDFVLSEGPEAFVKLIDEAPDALQYVWDRRWEAFRDAGGNPAERKTVVEDFLTLVATSAAYGGIDGLRQQTLAQHIGHILNIPAIELQRQMKRLSRRHRPRGGQQVQPGAYSPEVPSAERQLLEVLLDRPELFDEAAEKLDPEHFHDRLLRSIAERVWHLGHADRLSLEELMAGEDMVSLGAMLAELALAGQRRGNHRDSLHDAIAHLLDRQEREQISRIRQQGLTDDEALRALQERLRRADPRKRPGIL